MPIIRRAVPGIRGGLGGAPTAAEHLAEARTHERSGRLDEAIHSYEVAVGVAEQTGEAAILTEALRRWGVVCHHRGEPDQARGLCERSHEMALSLGDGALRHYRSSLDACRAAGDDQGCAIAYHDLGMISADSRDWTEAERIPLPAQIICIADVYEALTSTRSYRSAMSHEEGVERMTETIHWWRPDVFAAFLSAVRLEVAVPV